MQPGHRRLEPLDPSSNASAQQTHVQGQPSGFNDAKWICVPYIMLLFFLWFLYMCVYIYINMYNYIYIYIYI